LTNLPPIAISSVNPTAQFSTSPSPAPPSNVPSTGDMFKRGSKCDPLPSAPTPCASMFTLAEAKNAFTYVLERMLLKTKMSPWLYMMKVLITSLALSSCQLTDDVVNNLSYHDPDSKIQIKLGMGPIGCIKSFIHYVHFHEETRPIGND
jgi:hypothetical protein